jgi:hypothetical protein
MVQDGSMKKTIAAAEDEGERFIKHQSFDNFLLEQKKKCKDKHLPH